MKCKCVIGRIDVPGVYVFFFSSRRRHTRYWRDWSSDVCSSDLFPFIIGVGLVYYAIFIGISNTSDIRNSMLFSVSLFLLSYYYIIPRFENHGLWLSFLIFSFGRSIYLFICIRKKNMLKF